jgi:hypothetical protein
VELPCPMTANECAQMQERSVEMEGSIHNSQVFADLSQIDWSI